jgi:uncharacterized protein YjbI with pentapeptide repeats
MGIALLSSGFLAFAVLLFQGLVEDAAKAEEETARTEQNAADAEQAIALTTSISGFNPTTSPRCRAQGAQLQRKDAQWRPTEGRRSGWRQLPGRSPDTSQLERADLSEANLIGVDLTTRISPAQTCPVPISDE